MFYGKVENMSGIFHFEEWHLLKRIIEVGDLEK